MNMNNYVKEAMEFKINVKITKGFFKERSQEESDIYFNNIVRDCIERANDKTGVVLSFVTSRSRNVTVGCVDGGDLLYTLETSICKEDVGDDGEKWFDTLNIIVNDLQNEFNNIVTVSGTEIIILQ